MGEVCEERLESLRGESEFGLATRCRAMFAPEVCKEAKRSLGPQPWSSERVAQTCEHFDTALSAAGSLERALEQKTAGSDVEGTVSGKTDDTDEQMGAAGGALADASMQAKEAVSGTAGQAAEALQGKKAEVANALTGAVEGAGNAVAGTAGQSAEALQGKKEEVADALSGAVEGAGDKAAGVADALRGKKEEVAGALTGAVDGAGNAVTGTAGQAVEALKGKKEDLVSAAGDAAGALRGTIDETKDIKLFSDAVVQPEQLDDSQTQLPTGLFVGVAVSAAAALWTVRSFRSEQVHHEYYPEE